MTEPGDQSARGQTLDVGALIHSGAGIVSLLVGGLMYFYSWATPVFSGLMLLSAVSAIVISWRSDAWVPGHWLAMLPVIGILIGYGFASWGFTLAYVCLWIAFVHFIIRGVQGMRAAKSSS